METGGFRRKTGYFNMIEIQSWSSQLVSEVEPKLNRKKYDATFTYFGKYDDRSDWTSKYITSISNKIISVSYCPSDVVLFIDRNQYGIRELDDYKVPKGKILIDATTLALPELLHLFGVLNKSKRSFDVLYVQPTNYTESDTSGIDKIKTFELSDDGLGIQQVPPYIGYSSNSMFFFFLGWEGHRFGALINSDEFDVRDITCLIGIPPFKIGWENTTLSNNYRQLAEINSNTSSRFKFAGANDPVKTYEILEQIYQSATYEKKNICLAPFGTKPATIAAVQFAVNTNNVVMLYDFVKKKNKRSSGTDLLHLWEYEFIEPA